MPCEEFQGNPGSGCSGSQPFRVQLAPAAAVAMDFHAHLNMNEVVGLLGGRYDEESRVLTCETVPQPMPPTIFGWNGSCPRGTRDHMLGMRG